MIELRALGTLVLRTPDGADLRSVLAQPKRVALLAYLALARPRGFHRRDALLALLWPEQDEQHARWALNQALRHLRNALGKEVVSSRGDGEVGIDPTLLTCDAVDFERAIEAKDHAKAMALYQGDLLDGFHATGCGEFERWLEEERTWLRRSAARAASALAHRHAAQGEPVAAGHWARRAFALSPDDEAEARQLIDLLGRVGDRAGALQAYEEFARRLRVEYEADPAPETRALIAAVRAREHSAAAEVSPPDDARGPPRTETQAATPVAPVHVQLIAPSRSRHGRSLAFGSLLLAAAGLFVWGLQPGRPEPATPVGSSNIIAVLPFGYVGDPEFAYLGDGMVDLLSASLNGAGEIHTVDPHVVSSLTRQASPSSGLEQARRVGTRLRAGSFVVGDVVAVGGRLRISARLYRLPERGGNPASATVEGEPGGLFQLVDGLTSQLIAARSGGPSTGLARLAATTTDSLAALKAYLQGERQFLTGQPDSAVHSLERAIEIDSSFALAHYRMATAAMWTNRRPQAILAVDRALRFGHRLSDRDRKLIAALGASLRGHIVEAERSYREIVSRYPDDVEANYQLGDLIFHRHDVLERSWLDAREWFERVLAIDPGHQAALYHLSNIAARERKLQELDSLTERVLRIIPPPGWGFRGQRAVVSGDTAEVTRFINAMRRYSDDLAQPTLGFVAFTTGDLVVGRRLWRSLAEPSHSRGIRVLAHVTLAEIELMTGRWSATKSQLEAAVALDSATGQEHQVFFSLWPLITASPPELAGLRNSLLRRNAVLQSKAAPDRSTDNSLTAEHRPAHPYLRLYLLGLLDARLGDYTSALRYAADLERLSRASFAPSFVRDLGRAVHAEVSRGRGRFSEALALLDSVRLWTPEELELAGNSVFYMHEYERFTRAEVLNALGRDDEALRAYRSLADDLFHSGAPAHLRMAQIYERRGERQKAAEHYARFVELWKDCDAEFRPLVQDARRRMSG